MIAFVFEKFKELRINNNMRPYPSPVWALFLVFASSNIFECSGYNVAGISVHKVPLYSFNSDNNQQPPYCFAASSSLDMMGDPSINFLASQVWPSARVAASALERYKEMVCLGTVCEFGCGPGLPSITAAKLGCKKVFATDLDEFALKLVDHASHEQGLGSVIQTERLDITAPMEVPGSHEAGSIKIPEADIYLFSDIFESSQVAAGVARVSKHILSNDDSAMVWVFAQSDRACREDFLREMRQLLDDPNLDWLQLEEFESRPNKRLFLCNLDETKVQYA